MSAEITANQNAEDPAAEPTSKCPLNNPDMPMQLINFLNPDLSQVKTVLEDYAAYLRSLDRNRHGIGMKRQGFIDRATEYAIENPEFLPQYLTLEKFRKDNEYFNGFNNLYNLAWQIQELLWDITIEMSDIRYKDASEFYASVRRAAKHRIDAAESIHCDLEQFIKKRRTTRKVVSNELSAAAST